MCSPYEINLAFNYDYIHYLIFAAPSGQCMVDVAILVDVSYSIQDDWYNQLYFLTSLIKSLPVGNQTARVAIAWYSRLTAVVVHRFGDDQDRAAIEVKINGYHGRSHGETPSDTLGLQLVRADIFNQTAGDRADIPNVVIIVLQDNPSGGLTQTLRSELIQMQNIATIIPIGFLSRVSDQTLTVLASNPGTIFHPLTGPALSNITDEVVSAICDSGDR